MIASIAKLQIPSGESRSSNTLSPEELLQRCLTEKDRDARTERFRRMCPPLMRETDLTKLPAGQRKEVLEWKYGPQGLTLIGPTGVGKTRLMWLLLKRLFIDERREMMVYDGLRWWLRVGAQMGRPEKAEPWFERLYHTPLLVIDDAFKGRLTEAQATALWSVFDTRHVHKLPTIITTNATGETLLARMAEAGHSEIGGPLIRRIRESTQIVVIS